LLEGLIGPDASAHLTASLRIELGANGPLQEALVGRISHHVAALELSRRAELAALREGARQSVALSLSPGDDAASGLAPNLADAGLSAAVSSENLARIASYGRNHERGLLASLAKLQELSQLRPSSDGGRNVPRPSGPESLDAKGFSLQQHQSEQFEADPFGGDAGCEALRARSAKISSGTGAMEEAHNLELSTSPVPSGGVPASAIPPLQGRSQDANDLRKPLFRMAPTSADGWRCRPRKP
jgi:hypothetical protein